MFDQLSDHFGNIFRKGFGCQTALLMLPMNGRGNWTIIDMFEPYKCICPRPFTIHIIPRVIKKQIDVPKQINHHRLSVY